MRLKPVPMPRYFPRRVTMNPIEDVLRVVVAEDFAELIDGRVLVENERRPIHHHADRAILQGLFAGLLPQSFAEAEAIDEADRRAVVVDDGECVECRVGNECFVRAHG